MRLREPETREGHELVVDRVRERLLHAPPQRALDEPPPIRLQRGLAPLPAHRPPQPFRLPHAEPCQRHRHLQHLVLEDDDAERFPERLLQERMVGRRLVRRVFPQPLPPLDVRMDGLALDRPRPHEGDLHHDVVERLGPGSEDRLHLRAALDLERADRVRVPDLRERLGVVQRDPREVDRLVPLSRDPVHALLDRREHPEPEQVDLQEARVVAGVLVPLDELSPCHRRRLDRDELDQRAGRDHHPAGVL